MSSFEAIYAKFFCQLTGYNPFEYQVKVARLLYEGRNIVLRAPTGAGKTWSVLAPFLFPGWEEHPARLIYALPLRTLAQGIYYEACEAATRLGLPVEGEIDERGREIISPFVTLQTGEQPDDRFFNRGRIIITTYDQVLSGVLNAPYGISIRLCNVNAAIPVGSLVVFDEFHLMEPHRAFLTAVAGLHLFRDLCQSVWMTATATLPLEQVLADGLQTVSVPEDDAETAALMASVPSVSTVTKNFTLEKEPLSADAVLRCHDGRSIVLLNTVKRAQKMFEELMQTLRGEGKENKVILLHSRFFKEDRRAKEEILRSLFGKEERNSDAILVATQVIEAGIDISADHLHTELCPMNALVQRAGRCARFAGEKGTVHVYQLPMEERAWLPYGDVHREDETLTKTRELLHRSGEGSLHPRLSAEWVQEAHGRNDERALREGWHMRLGKCLGRIEQNAFLRNHKRVADLIRGGDTESIRVIVNDEDRRPDNPAHREGVNISRWTLSSLFRNECRQIGWYWSGDDEAPWKELKNREDVKSTYVVCLRPSVAAYDSDIGLRLGIPGTYESPERIEPPRPGYSPMRAEPWAEHARLVAAEAEKRLDREHWRTGLIARGMKLRYGLTVQCLLEAVRACALLHDLGKLQDAWQRWAEASQRAQDPSYQYMVPLAHTDFDSGKREDRQRERNSGIHRPPHAPAGAYYSRVFLMDLLTSVPHKHKSYVASACVAAILAHHGGWWQTDLELFPPKLCGRWEVAINQVFGRIPDQTELANLRKHKVEKLLKATTGADNLAEWWPLVAYLTRTLRLADQRATAEGAADE